MGNKASNDWRTFLSLRNNATAPTTPPTVSYAVGTSSYNRAAADNPRFRDLIRLGQNAANNMSLSSQYQKWSRPHSEVFFDFTAPIPGVPPPRFSQTQGIEFMDFSAVTAHFDTSGLDEANRRAIASLYRQLNSARHQFQGGVFVGEWHKTTKMMAERVKALAGGIKGFVKTGLKKISTRHRDPKTSQYLANLWLEGVYGWQPLVADISDACKALARLQFHKPVVRFRGFGVSERTLPLTPGVEFSDNSIFFTVSNVFKTTTRITYYGALRVPPYDDGLQTLNRTIELSGFDLASFVPTLWELVPYSFLIDYFSNVGDCLQAWTLPRDMVLWIEQAQRIESERFQTVTFNRAKTFNTFKNTVNFANVQVFSKDGSLSSFLTGVSRAQTLLPSLALRFTPEEVSWKQIANMAALLVGSRQVNVALMKD